MISFKSKFRIHDNLKKKEDDPSKSQKIKSQKSIISSYETKVALI